MSKSKVLSSTSLFAVLTIGLWGGAVSTAAAQDSGDEGEEIVVTGSLIRGTPETTALPVDVINQEELLNRGAPSTLDLIKTLPVSQGVLGDTNQFDARAQGSEGSGTVNLRGLGPTRTLVLLNGRRMPINPLALAGSGAVDTNAIPAAAIGRIEVLKDGAAAIYGSDAIAGVVNFITRTNFEGFELGANYEFIDGSDGDYEASLVWGAGGDNWRFLISGGYQHRSELGVLDRDWAHLDYLENPQGGWSAAGAPNSYIPLGLTSNRFRDPGCSTLGGTPGLTGAAPSITPVCYWQYTQFDNITELEDRYQIFSSFQVDLTDTLQFNIDALYARTDVPEWKTSPSYALLQGPTSTTSPVPGQYYVPGTNPGVAAFVAANPGGVPGVVASTGAASVIPIAAVAPGVLFIAGRPFALGGNPLFNFGASEGEREYDTWRISAGLTGEFGGGATWDFNLTYGEEQGYRSGRDTVVNRFQRALRGLGGPACPTVGGTPGVGGCMWFNPFASSIPGNAITGVANPGFNGSLGSNTNAELIDWFFPYQWSRQTAGTVVAEFVVSGETGFNFGGGNVAYAVGAQVRQDTFRVELSDINNLAINPCIDSVDFNINTCATPTGATGFLGGAYEQDLDRSVNALFGELNIPFSDAFEVQLAARWEDYGGQTGDTFDPKISARWQVVEGFAVRASAGSTFRGPALPNTTSGSVTSLQNVLGTFRAIDIFGNPGLAPESADTFNVGFIVEQGPFFATVDWWRFDFENPIITDPLAGMVAALFPNGLANNGNCGNPTYAGLQSRFTFTVAGCGPNNVVRVRTNTVNGSPIQTSGIDAQASLDFDEVFGGTLSIGGGGTYVLEYEVDPVTVEGIVVQQGFDAVGLLNYQTSVYPIPQLKGNLYAEWGDDTQNLRVAMNYVDSYTDQRVEPFVASVATNGTVISAGKEIDSFTSFDVNYRYDLPWNGTLMLGVTNLTDEDPSFARLDLNYDPFTGDAIGRTIRVGVRQRF